MPANSSNTILRNSNIILQPVTKAHAAFIYNLYTNPLVAADLEPGIFLPAETPEEFTTRILAACEYWWVIMLAKPARPVGDCALHHPNREQHEIETGGALLPDYWGQGIMRAAIDLMAGFACKTLQMQYLTATTAAHNTKALCMAEKAGFGLHRSDSTSVILRRTTSP